MKIFKMLVAALLVLTLKILGMVISVLARVGSIAVGPFLVYVIGCGIYCAVTASWRNLAILTVIGVAVLVVFMIAGLLLGLIDVAGDYMIRFMKTAR